MCASVSVGWGLGAGVGWGREWRGAKEGLKKEMGMQGVEGSKYGHKKGKSIWFVLDDAQGLIPGKLHSTTKHFHSFCQGGNLEQGRSCVSHPFAQLLLFMGQDKDTIEYLHRSGVG